MDRRKFMYGFGGAVIGTGAVLGSGAFTRMDADRVASVSVAGDSTAFLGLDASNADTVDSNLVTMNTNKLEITLDGSVGNSDGMNDEAIIEIGDISGNYPDPINGDLVAFTIQNNFDQVIDLEVQDDDISGENILELPYSTVDNGGTPDDETDDSIDDTMSGSDLTGTTITGIDPSDHRIYVAVRVNTETGSDLSGQQVTEITLSATPN